MLFRINCCGWQALGAPCTHEFLWGCSPSGGEQETKTEREKEPTSSCSLDAEDPIRVEACLALVPGCGFFCHVAGWLRAKTGPGVLYNRSAPAPSPWGTDTSTEGSPSGVQAGCPLQSPQSLLILDGGPHLPKGSPCFELWTKATMPGHLYLQLQLYLRCGTREGTPSLPGGQRAPGIGGHA